MSVLCDSGSRRDRPFVGRVGELSVLEAVLGSVREGAVRVVSVEGATGIGKTALVRRFTGAVGDVPILVAEAGHHGGHQQSSVVGQLIEALQQWVGEQASDRQWMPSPPAGPAEMADLLIDLVGAAQIYGPVITVVDQLDLADAGSAEALLMALRGMPPESRVLLLVVIGGAGPAGLDRGWRHLITDDDATTRLRLGELGPEDICRLAHLIGRGAVDMAAARRLGHHTAGRPGYIRELLEEVDPSGIVRSSGALPAPRSVSRRVSSQLEACSEATKALVRAAAVLGMRADLAQARVLAGLEHAVKPLDEAVSAGVLLVVPGTACREVAFPDRLTAAAVYDAMCLSQKVALHVRAANLLSGADQIRHRAAAAVGLSPGETEDLAASLEGMAQAELAKFELVEAAYHFRQAVSFSGDNLSRRRRLLSAVDSLLGAGDAAGAEGFRSDLELLARSDPAAGLLAGQTDLLRGQAGTGVKLLGNAMGGMSPTSDPEVASRAARQLVMLAAARGRPDTAAAWAEQTGSDSRLLGGQDLVACVFGMAETGRVADGFELLASSTAAVDDPADAGWLLARGALRMWSDQLTDAAADLELAVSTARASEDLQILAYSLMFLVKAEYRLGKWNDATAHAEVALSISGEAGLILANRLMHAMIAFPRAARGEWASTEAHLRAASDVCGAEGLEIVVACAARAGAAFCAARGDAEGQLEQVRRADGAYAPAEPAFFPGEPVEADALVTLGRLDEAEVSLSAFESRAVAFQRRSALLGAARVRGRLEAARGDRDLARAAFDAGLGLTPDLHLPFEVARLRFDYAQFLASTSSRRVARGLVSEAHDAFRRLGATPCVEACRSVLGRTMPGRLGRNDTDKGRLTATEHAIARLVANHRSNPEVAAKLHVSVKAVEGHLTRIYAKLGITSRRELSDRLGPLPSRPEVDA